jgi:ornithine cyclodeaminase
MKILSVEALSGLIRAHGIENYLQDLMSKLEQDFARWEEFNIIPRPAMHVPGGVLELMPVCDSTYYTFKYVNCHPKNPDTGLMTVVATGQLSEISTGYPLFFSEMTVLTALRTAATTALATKHLSRKDSHVLAIIGTGAQSEFLVKAIGLVRDITEVRFFDIDPKAMDKFESNCEGKPFALFRAGSVAEAVAGADIITTCTACKAHVDVLKNDWVKDGVHINGIGGDCPGKTELEVSILSRAKIVVEYFDQSIIEGEVQRWTKEEGKKNIYGELYEIIRGEKAGRTDAKDITLYDSVGIALEDYSVLTLTYELMQRYGVGMDVGCTPELHDPKNLMSVLM